MKMKRPGKFERRANRRISAYRQQVDADSRRERFLIIALVMLVIGLILAGMLAYLIIDSQLPGTVAPCNLGNFRYCGCDGFFCWP